MDPPADPVSRLRQAARDGGFWISPADEVRTDCAAALLGVRAQTLRADRAYWQRVPSRRIAGRVVYRLRDLADYLAGC